MTSIERITAESVEASRHFDSAADASDAAGDLLGRSELPQAAELLKQALGIIERHAENASQAGNAMTESARLSDRGESIISFTLNGSHRADVLDLIDDAGYTTSSARELAAACAGQDGRMGDLSRKISDLLVDVEIAVSENNDQKERIEELSQHERSLAEENERISGTM